MSRSTRVAALGLLAWAFAAALVPARGASIIFPNADVLTAAAAPDSGLSGSGVSQPCSCPAEASDPVCAETAGVSFTVASRCYAECQQLANIRAGSCEALAVDAPDQIDAQSTEFNQGPSATLPTPPPFRTNCRPPAAMLRQMLQEGRTFVGCVSAAPNTAASTVATNKSVSAYALLQTAKPSDTAILSEYVTASRGGARFIRPTKTTVGSLTATNMPAVMSIPGRQAPQPEAWAKDRNKIIRPSSIGDIADTFNHTVQNYGIQHADLDVSHPEPWFAGMSTGGNRRLLQTDNRYFAGVTTVWPLPTLVQILGVKCSGTIISPEDVLTAAHCVQDEVTGASRSFSTITPGKEGWREPYGRLAARWATTWHVWFGRRGYNGDRAITGGSAYIDIAVITLQRPVTWWTGVGYTCGWRSFDGRACGYPTDRDGGNVPYCSDGTTMAMDYCDSITDYVQSRTIFTKGGQSGGPLWDKFTKTITGIVSGGPWDSSDNWYTPLDNHNWGFLFNQPRTIWGRSYGFLPRDMLLMSSLNNRCLDAPNRNAPVRVIMWDCSTSGRNNNQLWVKPGPWDLRIKIKDANLCLDVNGASTSNGTPIILWYCNSGDNQKWLVDSSGRLRSMQDTQKCIDIIAANPNNGAQLVLWDCHDGSNQRWVPI